MRERGAHILRLPDRELAFRRRAGKLRRVLLGEAEIDVELPVVDLDRQLLRLRRRLEWQRKVQRQLRILRIVVEIVAAGGLVELHRLAVRLGLAMNSTP